MTSELYVTELPISGSLGAVRKLIGAGATYRLTQVDHEPGTFKFSVYAKADSAVNLIVHYGTQEVTTPLTTVWSRVECSLTSEENSYLELEISTDAISVYLYEAQLERGSVLTDWKPAAEDYITDLSEIRTLTARAMDKANTADSKAVAAQSAADGAMDKVIDVEDKTKTISYDSDTQTLVLSSRTITEVTPGEDEGLEELSEDAGLSVLSEESADASTANAGERFSKVIIDDDSVDVVKNGQVVASFGENTVIGSGNPRVEIDNEKVAMVDERDGHGSYYFRSDGLWKCPVIPSGSTRVNAPVVGTNGLSLYTTDDTSYETLADEDQFGEHWDLQGTVGFLNEAGDIGMQSFGDMKFIGGTVQVGSLLGTSHDLLTEVPWLSDVLIAKSLGTSSSVTSTASTLTLNEDPSHFFLINISLYNSSGRTDTWLRPAAFKSTTRPNAGLYRLGSTNYYLTTKWLGSGYNLQISTNSATATSIGIYGVFRVAT